MIIRYDTSHTAALDSRVRGNDVGFRHNDGGCAKNPVTWQGEISR